LPSASSSGRARAARFRPLPWRTLAVGVGELATGLGA
jgi:hypothetical protein